ncbi:unnamed protein product, partial [Chrysoparadoxa australica]
PVITRDDGKQVAYLGEKAKMEVVDKDTGKDGFGSVVTLPLDVRIEGLTVMDALGTPADVQATMWANWLALTVPEKTAITDQYALVDKSDNAQVLAFVQSMINSLT